MEDAEKEFDKFQAEMEKEMNFGGEDMMGSFGGSNFMDSFGGGGFMDSFGGATVSNKEKKPASNFMESNSLFGGGSGFGSFG